MHAASTSCVESSLPPTKIQGRISFWWLDRTAGLREAMVVWIVSSKPLVGGEARDRDNWLQWTRDRGPVPSGAEDNRGSRPPRCGRDDHMRGRDRALTNVAAGT